MDYEKMYKDALSRAMYLKENTDSVGALDVSNCITHIFPKLKESEEEKIRKELYDFCIKCSHGDTLVNQQADFQRWATWLEKQGEQETFCDECRKEHPSHSCQDITELGRCAIEHTEKPTDKVEPKFKVGDWVVREYTKDIITINQVVDVKRIDDEHFGYTLDDGTYFSGSWESSYHLWTIQDAKDGDVLQLGEVTAIFKEFIGNEHCRCYCSIYNGEFEIPSQEGDANSYGCYNATPAAKEQHDLLFQKMKESGYEWDAGKKELKKIDIITPLFNVGDTIIKKHNSDINDFGQFTITDITGGKYWYNDRIICDITEQDEWELYEPVRQKSAWSEKDELILEAIYYTVNGYEESIGVSNETMIGWLKSLKDRVQPQPRKEWRGEDETALSDALWCCKQAASIAKNENDMGTIWYAEDWLKSLKNRVQYTQTKWKPSEEQMQVLTWCLPLFYDPKLKEILKSLIDELKKL